MIKRNILNSLISVLILFVLLVRCEDPKITRNKVIKLNPGCPECSNEQINVIYIRAASSNDVLHYLYAGGEVTKTLSAVIIRSTDNNSLVQINWDNFKSNNSGLSNNSIELIGQNFSSIFGMVFTKLYLYKNGKDMTDLIQWGFNEFKWQVITDANLSISFVSNEFSNSSNMYNLFGNDSQIIITFTYNEYDMDKKEMPRLHYNSNNTIFNMVLKNLNTSGLQSPRFMVQLGLINNGERGSSMRVEPLSSFDDELSPGVFRIINFMGQNTSNDIANQTYVQWKPVCYTKYNDYSITSISITNQENPIMIKDSNDMDNVVEIIKPSIVYLVTRGQVIEPTSTTSLVNVTFGSSDDKGYSNYLIWYGSFGYGRPPTINVSIVIIMVIIFGLGLPFILVVVGSIYLIIKKRLNRNRPNSYATIDEQIN